MMRPKHTVTRTGAVASGGARFVAASSNSKLARLKLTPAKGRPRRVRRVPVAPFIASTDVSIDKTCDDYCPFKENGCWAQAGSARFTVDKLDAAAKHVTPRAVIRNMVRLVDESFGGATVLQDDGKIGGRDLRLMNSGDFIDEVGARLGAGAAERWLARRGGAVFGFTRLWRLTKRQAFGRISILASVETVAVTHRPTPLEYRRPRRSLHAIASFCPNQENRNETHQQNQEEKQSERQ